MQTTVIASLIHDASSAEIISQLDYFTVLFNKIQRKLYAGIISYYRKNNVNSLPQDIINQFQRDFPKKFGINKRQYSSIYKNLFAKINSVLELNKNYIEETQDIIEDLNKFIKAKETILSDLQTKMKKSDYVFNTLDKANFFNLKKKIFYKKIRFEKAKARLIKLQRIEKTGIPHICFGSKKLFNQQFQINSNNNQSRFTSHDEWYKFYNHERHKNFLMIGSHDETSGNTNCQIKHIKGNIYELIVNVNHNATKIKDKYATFRIKVHNDRNNYLFNAVKNNKNKDKSKTREENLSQAITYRFSKDYEKNNYTIDISFDKSIQKPNITSYQLLGVIGVDINADHLSMAEIDHYGNYIYTKDFQLDLKNKTSDEATNSIGCAVKEIIAYANSKSKPIVIEDLDFKNKKKQLKDSYNKKYNIILSSFAYSKIIELIKSRAFDSGVEIIETNPAYTSKIGKFKYQSRYKLTTHQAAAFVIARRGFFSCKKIIKKEVVKVNKETQKKFKVIEDKEVLVLHREKTISVPNEKYYPFVLPARNSKRKKFLYWKEVEKNCLKAKKERDNLKRKKLNSLILDKQDLPRDSQPIVVDNSEVNRSLDLFQPF